MKNLIKNLLTKEDLDAIVAAIGEAEKTTAGEIRVSIREKRRWREKTLSMENLARKEFRLLGMNKTKDRTGVLLFFLLQDQKFFILADEGIHTKVEQETWKKIAEDISTLFSDKQYRAGIAQGVSTVGKILSQNFPKKPNDTNELPNEVRIR